MTTSEREREIRMKIADDKVYGEVRAEICDEYIADGKPQPESNWLYSKLVTLRLEHRDLERTFDLTWAAQMRAVEVWRKANPGNDLVLPDHQKLVEFLLAQLDEARQHPFMLRGARAFLARVASRLSVSPNYTWNGIWQDAGARDACGIVRAKIFELVEAELKEGK